MSLQGCLPGWRKCAQQLTRELPLTPVSHAQAPPRGGAGSFNHALLLTPGDRKESGTREATKTTDGMLGARMVLCVPPPAVLSP